MPNDSEATFHRLVDALGYRASRGLVEKHDQAAGARAEVLRRLKRVLPEVDATYFSDDEPLAYFARLARFDAAQVVNIHRKVWNDSRVPLLFIITPSEVRLYDAQARPTAKPEGADDSERLITRLDAAASFLKRLHTYRREALDTGSYARGQRKHFKQAHRCDATLLANLQAARKELRDTQLHEDAVHPLLLRAILLLHLQHRHVLPEGIYETFKPGAQSLLDLLAEKEVTYRFFGAMAQHFNGDLLPVSSFEQKSVGPEHLSVLRDFLSGKLQMKNGQHELWPLYDFSIIPIPTVSALYKELLHTQESTSKKAGKKSSRPRAPDARQSGAFYTQLPLVELVMNEVLPWPSPEKPLQHLPRIIDPTCGSGVFLVEAFRRLAAHLRSRKPSFRLTGKQLSQLLTRHVFGVDSNPAAVKVAAFSLYLALLDELEQKPEELWETLRFPTLTIADTSGRPNLQQGDSFRSLSASAADFDLIVGNPPWKRTRLPESAADFCAKRELPVAHELAHPFMWLARELLKADGRAAIICPSKWLTNQEGPDREFRRAFFARTEVETLVNLTALRHGLFPEAAGPACITVFRLRTSSPSPSILYAAPQGGESPVPLGLVIDAGDMHWVPRDDAEQQEDVWRVLQVATWRDVLFLRRLRPQETLAAFIKAREAKQEEHEGWKAARGFQRGGNKSLPELATMGFVRTQDVEQLVLRIAPDATPAPHTGLSRTGDKRIYWGPHVLFRKGHHFTRVMASYVEESCSFQDAVLGIHAPASERPRLKALAAYLNSSFARYWLFLIGASLGAKWDYRSKEERLSLPAAPVAQLESSRSLAALVDEWVEASASRREALKRKMDEVVYEALQVSAAERTLVEGLIALRTTARKGGTSPHRKNAFGVPERRAACHAYASAFLEVFRNMEERAHWPERAEVRVGNEPLLMVTVYFRGRGRRRSSLEPVQVKNGLGEVLMRVDASLLERESTNIYRRRHLRFFEDGAMHVIKPAEPRFWTRSTGYADAEALLAEAVAQGMAHGTA